MEAAGALVVGGAEAFELGRRLAKRRESEEELHHEGHEEHEGEREEA